MSNKLKQHIMRSNKLFNLMFLAFSFAIIIVVSINIQLTHSALSKTASPDKTFEQPEKNVVAVSHHEIKAQTHYKI